MTSIFPTSLGGLLKTASVVAIATSVFTSQAVAQAPEIKTESYTSSLASTLTNWNHAFNLTKFDASKGQLLSVEITIGSSVTTSLSVTNTAASVSNGTIRTNYTFYLSDPIYGGNVPAIISLAVPAPQGFPPSEGLAFSLGQNQTFLSGPQARSASDVKTYTDGGILAYFTGSGNVVLNGTTVSNYTLTAEGGNLNASQTTYSDAAVTVKYTYEAAAPVPEPGTWAAMAMGAGLLLASSRFRRRA